MIVALAGALISLAALSFASVRWTSGRLLIALSLLALHVGASVAYYFYIQHSAGDALTYYSDSYHLSRFGFSSGSVFTAKLTQFLKRDMGGSFFECFVFFQSIGFWGIMALMRTFQEISFKLSVPESTVPLYLLFLPSVQFWTSAIGKDAPLFFALAICVWSALEWRRRLIPFGIGVFVMVLFRAHIAFVAVIAISAAAALHSRMSFGRKALILGGAVMGALFLVGSVQSNVNVNVMSVSSITSFLQDRSDIAAKIGGRSTFGNASIPIRFASLLFRPFFFDADGALALVASFENVGSVVLLFYFIRNWRKISFLAKRVFFIEYCLVLVAILTVMLTVVNYNIGTGLRERVMIFPALFSIFAAVWTMSRRNPASAQPIDSRGFQRIAQEDSRRPELTR